MDVQISSLCDAAADFDGKLCLLGCFDTIFAQRFPAVHAQCSVALRLIFRKEEEGHHKIRVNFIDADGRSVIPPLDTEIEIGVPEDLLFITKNLVLNLQQIRIEGPGHYSVDVSLGERIVARIPLKVREIAPQPEAF